MVDSFLTVILIFLYFFCFFCSVELVLVDDQYFFVLPMEYHQSSFRSAYFFFVSQQRLMKIELIREVNVEIILRCYLFVIFVWQSERESITVEPFSLIYFGFAVDPELQFVLTIINLNTKVRTFENYGPIYWVKICFRHCSLCLYRSSMLYSP